MASAAPAEPIGNVKPDLSKIASNKRCYQFTYANSVCFSPTPRPGHHHTTISVHKLTATRQLFRKRKNAEEKERRAKFKRGEPIATKQLPDRKLKGKLRYSEKLVGEAAAEAAQADEWLLPSEAGTLEAEGMERTWRFSQEAIVQGEPPPLILCYTHV